MKIIVVGAGIAGLGAATYFAGKGHEVSVYEADDHPGGRAITLRRPGSSDRVDAGTQYYHSSYQRALGLIRRVGLDTQLSVVKGYTRIYDSRRHKGSFLYSNTLPWEKSIGIAGNLQLGWFQIRNLLRYRINLYGLDNSSETDAVDVVAMYRDKVAYECIIRPLAQVGALAEPDAMGLSLHQLVRLMHIVLHSRYLSLAGGTASLHEALARRLDINYEAPVKRLCMDSGRISGVELDGSGRQIGADHIVIATTPPAALGLLPEDWVEAVEFLSSVRIPAFTLPTFFLDGPLERNVWSYLLHHLPDSRISYITDAACKNPAMVPSGKAVIQPWICFPESVTIAMANEDEIIRLCMDELETVFPGFASRVEDVVLTRHAFGVPFHSTGHHARAARFLQQMDRRGISFCGDYLSGGYMESALWSAERAAFVHG